MNSPIPPTFPKLSPRPAKSLAPIHWTRRRLLIVGAVGAVLVALIIVWRVRGAKEKAHALEKPKRDVPTLDGKSIVFSPAFRERAGIKVAAVERTSLTPVIKVVGTVTFDPDYTAAVSARINGILSKVLKVEGDAVKKGDALAEIQSAELGHAQAEILVAQAHKKAAELNATREDDLATRRLTTAREAEVARATFEEQRAMLSAAQQRVAALGGTGEGAFGTYVLRAPMNGSVVERRVSPGQTVDSNLVAFRVTNLNYLWIGLALFEQDIGSVRDRDRVEISPLSDSQQKITGHVAHVGEVIDLATRSTEVRVEVDNSSRLLRPGQSVSAMIRASGPERVVPSIPQSAITYVDGKPTVFVAESDTRVVPTPITLGGTDGKRQEALEGLREGQRVVVEGVFALKSELFR